MCVYIPVDLAVQKAKFRSRISPTVSGRFIITSPNSASILCQPFSATISSNEENTKMFGILRIPGFVNHKGKDVNSDWLTDRQNERSILGHAQFYKQKMKGHDPDIDTAQTPKRFDGRLALLKKIRKTVGDSIQAVSLIVTNSKDRSIEHSENSFQKSLTIQTQIHGSQLDFLIEKKIGTKSLLASREIEIFL